MPQVLDLVDATFGLMGPIGIHNVDLVVTALAQLFKQVFPVDRPSLVHSHGSLRFVTPPMCCLDIVRMIISPRPTHSFGILVVWDNVVVVGELLVADCAYSFLLGDFPLQKFPHFGGGSELSIAPRMMRVLNASNSGLYRSHTMRSFSPAAADGFVDGTVFIWTEFHGHL